MKKGNTKILFILLLFSNISFAQHQADNWFFGNNAGLNFGTGSPVSIPNGQVASDEGVSSISDINGNLLFYTDGVSVWNSSHTTMPNGTGLGGNFSSTQSALIIPLHGSNTLYYIFTTAIGGGDFMYSIVDMTAMAGLGNVTVKNMVILSGVTEKLCGIKQPNNIDYWIIVHENGNNVFDAFTFSATGVNSTPVASNAGSVNGGQIGYLKASYAGDKLAAALWDSGNLIELFDFDNVTGIVSNALTLPFHAAGSGAYGVEFSRSGKYLYASWISPGEIRQYDIQAGSPAAIAASEVLIGTTTASFNGSLQMAPDKKIYLAQYQQSYLGVINDPEQPGLSCNFTDVGFNMTNGTGRLGLPYFPYDLIDNNFQFDGICIGDSTYFSFGYNPNIGGVSWNFGDTASGINNSSFLNNPTHLFSDTGTFQVQLIKFYLSGINDTVFQEIIIRPLPVVFLGNDTTLCTGSSILLNPGNFQNYLWQDSTANSSYMVTVSGSYAVEISDGYCHASDTIQIAFSTCSAPSVLFSSSDTSFCDKKCLDFTDLSANSPTSWYWSFPGADSTSSTAQNPVGICYNAYGSFDVTLIACNAAGCDTLIMPGFINEYQLPPVPIITQNGYTLTSTPAYSYQWYLAPNAIPGATGQSYTVTQPGVYYVIITDSVGCASSSAFVTGVGIDEQVSLQTMQLMPGFNHSWLLSLQHVPGENVLVKILDTQGRIIFEMKPQNVNGTFTKEILLDGKAPGLYFLVVSVGDQFKVTKINN